MYCLILLSYSINCQEANLYNRTFPHVSLVIDLHELNDTLNVLMTQDECVILRRLDTFGIEISEFDLACVSTARFGRYIYGLEHIGENRYYATWGGNDPDNTDFLNWNIWVTRFDLTGEIEFQKQFDFEETSDGVRVLRALENDEFLIAGFSRDGLDKQLAMVMKSDAEGEILWRWTKDYTPDGRSIFWGLDVLPNGNIVCSGQAYDPETLFHENYVALLNSEGNLLWDQSVGNASVHNTCRVFNVDQELLLLGENGSNLNGETGIPYLVWLDYDGNILHEQTFGDEELQYISPFVPLFLENEIAASKVVVGDDLRANSKIYQMEYNPSNVNVIDVPGEEGFNNYIHNMIPCSSGGYYAGGLIEGFGQQKGWLLKTDENFNTVPLNADSTLTEMEELEELEEDSVDVAINDISEFAFTLTPNPASNIIQLSFPDPLLFQFSYFRLYNELGQEVFYRKLEAWEDKWTLDISNLPQGIYFYDLKTERKRLSSGKLLVE